MAQPGTQEFTLKINGQYREVEADPQMPLLWVLRDLLGLRGTKYACGVSACGACTVLLDGTPVRSCVATVESAAGRHILSIEGLGGDHPVQRAWLELQVPQCGYCQSGQIMQAVALLDNNVRPTREQVRSGMNGILCRCGTDQRIRRAIPRAAGTGEGGGE